MRELYAFLDGDRLGVFEETGDERCTFSYFGQPKTPLSLSVPARGGWDSQAPFNYLENLLPENDDARARLAKVSQTQDDVFSLLSIIGEDVAGAVSLSPNPDLPDREPDELIEATEDDIAFRVGTLRKDPSSPPPADTKPRWSLAGQQAKFSLSLINDRWFWSTYEQPSTHIFKPSSTKHQEVDQAEAACLRLARELGVPASTAEVVEFAGEKVFAVARWDRFEGVRLHAEDLTQALGQPGHDKYSVPAEDVISALRPHGQEWAFVDQLVFNTAVGNADAHAKNYSVLLAGDQVRLAPLYDTLPLSMWPHVDQRVAMHINHEFFPSKIEESDWVSFAKENNLSEDRVLASVRRIYAGVRERLADVLTDAGVSAEKVELVTERLSGLPRMSIPHTAAVAPRARGRRAKTTPGSTAGSFAPIVRGESEPPVLP